MFSSCEFIPCFFENFAVRGSKLTEIVSKFMRKRVSSECQYFLKIEDAIHSASGARINEFLRYLHPIWTYVHFSATKRHITMVFFSAATILYTFDTKHLQHHKEYLDLDERHLYDSKHIVHRIVTSLVFEYPMFPKCKLSDE